MTANRPKPRSSDAARAARELTRRLRPILARAAEGDFDRNISFPAAKDEFTDIYVGLQLMLEEVREKMAEEKGSREELAETVRQLGAVIRGSADGILVMNQTGQIELFNPALEDLTGHSESDARGQTVHALLKPRGEDGNVFDFVWLRSETKRRKDTPPVRNATIRTKGGATRWVGVTAGPEVSDARGLHTVVVIRDIGEQHELIRRQREFVSITSHELRTPITAMLGYLSLIKNSLARGGVELEPLVRRAYEATVRMSELVEDLLSVARLEEGRLQLSQAPVNPGRLVADVAADLQPAIARKSLTFTLNSRLQPRDLIKVDKQKFNQVVRNLLDNAIKFTPEGGRITAIVRPGPRRITVTIRDNGTGIAADNLKRIFEKFFREYREGSVTGGSGLGLFITKELVDRLGGRLTISSRPRKQAKRGGTTATVSFPRHVPSRRKG
jgi:PAS domain S-box-containing protein